ncbi:MAG: hypothetical protein IJA21_00900 [Clostridia bacterium]|nr:hypothetical protein [Clostridia bacterium]
MIGYVGNKYKLALRGTFSFLLYSGIVNIVGILFSFYLKINLGNDVYQLHHCWIYINIAEWVAFIIAFGLKYVENVGYIDDYDHVHYYGSYLRVMALVLIYIFIPPLLSLGGGGAVFSTVISICYQPNLLLSNLINNHVQSNDLLIQAERMFYWPQVAGLMVTLPINFFALYPFYILGKRNRKRDLKEGIILRIKR